MRKIMWGILKTETPIRYTRASISFFEMPCIIFTFFFFDAQHVYCVYQLGVKGGKKKSTKIHWFFLPQANGCTCVNFGCTHPIDGLFQNLPLYLLGFFSKYECWVIDLVMPLYHFILWGCHFVFLYREVSYH